jgi:hypothetical protein
LVDNIEVKDMPARRRPSIFDVFEDFTKGFPFGRDVEDLFQEPF